MSFYSFLSFKHIWLTRRPKSSTEACPYALQLARLGCKRPLKPFSLPVRISASSFHVTHQKTAREVSGQKEFQTPQEGLGETVGWVTDHHNKVNVTKK